MRKLIFILTIIIPFVSMAQVPVPTGSYFQDFGTVDILSWTNNSTYPGWYQSGTFQGHQNITTASPSNTGGFYSYECNSNNDQKIGSRASGGTNTIRYGVVLQNTTGSTISNVRVAYEGYQLSLAQNGNTNVIGFDYIVSTSVPAVTAAGGTAVSALNFTQLQSNPSSGSNQVMGYPCTQMSFMSSCITVTIPNNSYILLRWTDVDDSGNDHHMAIDDVDVQFLATNLTVNSATICTPQSTTLTATGASSFSWTPTTGLSPATGSVVVANPTVTTTYTVSGTVSSCPVKTVTSVVTVNTGAPVSVTSQTICSTNSTTLTASGSVNYSWSPTIGLSATTGSMVVANPAITQVYTVTGTGGPCPTPAGTGTVTVLPTPVLTAASQTICSTGSATLNASGATNYTWSPATGLSTTTGNVVVANPAVTTVYTLNGDNGSCTAIPLTVTVTVVTSPSITVNSATLCPSGTANLTATGATSYSWSPNSNISSTSGSNVTVNPPASTVYTVTGSIPSCPAVTATSTITVLTVPVISVNSQSICPSGSATLTASGAANYTWSPATNLSATTGNTVNANPSLTTVYTINASSGVCPITPVTATVTIVPNPVLSVSSQTICSSNSTALTASGATNYTWSPATGLSATTGNVVTANPSSTTVYTIMGDNGACQANPVTATLTVIQSPVLSVASTSLCASGSVILTVSGASNYIWTPAATLSSSTGNIVTANPLSTTIYTVTGFIATCSVAATSTLTVVPVNKADFSYESSTYCLASSSNPIPGITGATGGTFSALPTGIAVDNITGIIDLALSAQNTYTVSYTTAGDCNETKSFVVNISPTPTLIVNSATICAGEAAPLTANPSSSGGTFNWVPGNTTNASLMASPGTSTTYTVTYSLNGCSTEEVAHVEVNSSPSLTITPSSDYVVDGDDITLTATGADSYSWDNGSFGSVIHLSPTQTSDYCVTGTSGKGCLSTSCFTVEVTKESTLYVPNTFTPNGDQLNDVFQVPTTNMTEFNIKIFDRWGSLLFESSSLDKSWDGTYKGADVAEDVYVYSITGKGADKIDYAKRGHVTLIR